MLYISIPTLFNVLCWNGKFCSQQTEQKPFFFLFPLLIYMPLSFGVTLSPLTPPTLSSVVSNSDRVLVLLAHPHILQTPAKFWLHSGEWKHTHTTFKAKRHKSLSKWHSAIDWMARWSHSYCPRRSLPLGPDGPKASTWRLRAFKHSRPLSAPLCTAASPKMKDPALKDTAAAFMKHSAKQDFITGNFWR